MAEAIATYRVEGMAHLLRALKKADEETFLHLRAALIAAAVPIKDAAERFAAQRITNLQTGDPWDQFRVGTNIYSVYIVPQKRGTHVGPRRRPQFGARLMDEALEPALLLGAIPLTHAVSIAIDQVMERNF